MLNTLKLVLLWNLKDEDAPLFNNVAVKSCENPVKSQLNTLILVNLVLEPRLNVLSSKEGLTCPEKIIVWKLGDVSTPFKSAKVHPSNLIPNTPGNEPKVYGSSSPAKIPDMFQKLNVIAPPPLLLKTFGLKLPFNLNP